MLGSHSFWFELLYPLFNADSAGYTVRGGSSVTHGQKGLGDYTIPMANKFAADGDPKTLGEIYAYGFRNAHRLS